MATQDTDTPQRHTAGLLDIRNIIGGLLAAYGLILTLMGLFGDAQTEKTGGPNANLWSGLVLLAVGIGFMAWAKLRPVVVPTERVGEPHHRTHGH